MIGWTFIGNSGEKPVGEAFRRIVCYLQSFQPAHVAGGAGGDGHICGGEFFRVSVEVHLAFLSVVKHPMFRLMINLDL